TNDGALRKTGAGTTTYAGGIGFGTNAARVNSDAGNLVLSGGQSGSGGTNDAQYGGAGNTTVSGVIAATVNHVNYDGNGTLTLGGNNLFTGGIVDSGGGTVNFSRSAGNVGPTLIGSAVPTWVTLSNGSTFQSTTTGNGGTFLDRNKGISLAGGGGTISSTDPTASNVSIYRGIISG